MSESPAPTLRLHHARSFAVPCTFAPGDTIYNAHIVVSRDDLDGCIWNACIALGDTPHQWLVDTFDGTGIVWGSVVIPISGENVSVFDSPEIALATAWATPEVSPRF